MSSTSGSATPTSRRRLPSSRSSPRRRQAGEPSLLGEPRHPAPRDAVAELYKRRFDVDVDPETQIVATIGAKEGLAHLMWVLLEPGDVAVVPTPSYPIHLVAPRLAGATVVGHGHRGDRGRRPLDDPGAARRRHLVPAQPDDGDRDARAHAAARRPRARTRPDPRARLRVRRHRVRRARAAVGAAGGGRRGVRGRALQPDEVVLDGRLARRVRRRPAGRRAGAREAEVVPRLRDVPADPDRVDRRAARVRRTTRRRSARSIAAAATRSARGSPAPAGTSSRRAGRCSSGRRSPSRSATRARSTSPCGSRRRRTSRSARASASARAATATCASRSSRTSSGSRRRRARSGGCSPPSRRPRR